MAGSTATINVEAFRDQWDAGVPMAVLCVNWTITKDQLIRLKSVWSLPLRHDRARKRSDVERPSAAEERASRKSLALAPAVEERAAAVRRLWTLEVEHSRRGSHSGHSTSVNVTRIFSLRAINDALADSLSSD